MTDGTWITLISIGVTVFFMLGVPVFLVHWFLGDWLQLCIATAPGQYRRRPGGRLHRRLCIAGHAALHPDRGPDQPIGHCPAPIGLRLRLPRLAARRSGDGELGRPAACSRRFPGPIRRPQQPSDRCFIRRWSRAAMTNGLQPQRPQQAARSASSYRRRSSSSYTAS